MLLLISISTPHCWNHIFPFLLSLKLFINSLHWMDAPRLRSWTIGHPRTKYRISNHTLLLEPQGLHSKVFQSYQLIFFIVFNRTPKINNFQGFILWMKMHDVFRFNISMNNPLFMAVIECPKDLIYYYCCHFFAESFLSN